MTKESYIEGIALIEKQYKDAKSQLGRQYAEANNPHKKGDIVSDSVHTIQIDKIRWGTRFGSDVPESVYEGPSLTKQGKPYKNGDRAQIWQSGLKQN